MILLLIVAFLIGSLPFGYLIGRAFGVDLRRRGSGSTGATNVGRQLGKGPYAATLLLDSLKGVLTIILARYYSSDAIWVVSAGLAAIAGHCFSPFLGFRGGKGVATSLGVVMMLEPTVALACLVVWCVSMAINRIVSLASIIAVGALGLAQIGLVDVHPYTRSVLGGLSLLVIAMHRSNISRLLRHEEKRFEFASEAKK